MTTSTDTNLTSIGGQWMIHQPKAVIKQQHHLSNTRETKQNNEVPLKKNFIPIWNYCSSVIYCLVWCSATNQIAQWDRMYWKGAGPLLSFWDSFVNILPVQRICPYDTPLFKYPSDDHSDKIFPRSEITVSVHNCLSYSQSFHKKVDLASNVQLAYSHQLFFFISFFFSVDLIDYFCREVSLCENNRRKIRFFGHWIFKPFWYLNFYSQ